MSEEKILPCPFCGDAGEKGTQQVTMMNAERTAFNRVICRCCGAMAPELNWQCRASNPPTEPKWLAASLNRRVIVEQLMFDSAKGKRPMPTADELREWALKLGTPGEGEPAPVMQEGMVMVAREPTDTVRLDWLQERKETVYLCSHSERVPTTDAISSYEKRYFFDGWAVLQDQEPHATIREAIDFAMIAAAPKQGEPK